MNEKRVKRYSLSQQVADQLETMIANGIYAVGDRIPTESELTAMFSVSRNTLREAIQSLTSAGILIVKQGDGTYVRANNRFHAHMSLEYEQVSLANILEARNALEVTIAHLAAERRTDEELSRIRETFLIRQNSKEKEKEQSHADVQFHMAIAESCHNKILHDLYSSISSYLENHIADRQAKTSLNAAQIDALHEQLFIAIRDQLPEKASVCAQNILKI